MSRPLLLLLAACCWAAAAALPPHASPSAVNISDAWLLSDGESAVFYRHFRDKVTWSEADSICQFHHSVLATVRNTAEFDRTRALLRQLEWSGAVWVGLRRVDGQPMFKWSTPAGATLEASEGYWHEAPGGATSAPQCVAIDPAADFRWRAVDCSSSLEIHSFLCQIPVPLWVRAEQGGCLSSKWPNAEVTVQYIPQTRALEMTADCGLSGTRRIACKRNSEKDLRKMEQKLQCGAPKVDAAAVVVVEAAPPITRHRRDVAAVDAPSPSPVAMTSTDAATSAAVTSTPVVETTSAAPPSPSPTITTTTPAPTTTVAITRPTTVQRTSTEAAPMETSSVAAPVASTMTMTTTPPPSERMNVEIIAHIFDTSTDGAAISRVVTVEETRTEEQQQTMTTAEHGQQEVAPPAAPQEEDAAAAPPVVVAKHHHVTVAGTPRNVASPPLLQHPPMAAPHHLAPGVPRIVAPPQAPHPQQQPPFFYHPTAHADGRPRTVGADTRSAEDHVALRRKQLLPTPLQGPSLESQHHVPMMYHEVPLEATTTATATGGEVSDKTEEEDIEFEDEEPQALREHQHEMRTSTEDALNAETEEELVAAEQRLKGRRVEEKPRERHLARSLYPFILNRLLG